MMLNPVTMAQIAVLQRREAEATAMPAGLAEPATRE